ncbi:uncharacterized protein [Triticum aestivum]|uniref:uncharacterized protein isoform X1 n=1 Tax=Triticum aestivum TaxID=4565 RepID=UPI001D016D8A|nr:uncharacterized protein LOC123098228 isoform X1 [Triticum aestivum]
MPHPPLVAAGNLRCRLLLSSLLASSRTRRFLPRAMESSSSTAAAAAEHAGGAAAGEYEEVLARLSSLITQKVHADTGNRGNQWDLMGRYLQILELEEPIAQMKVIHVAGTKGHPCRAARSGSSDSSTHQSGTPSLLRPDSPLASVRRCPRSKGSCPWILPHPQSRSRVWRRNPSARLP